MRIMLNRGYLWGKGMIPLYGGFKCSKCNSKKIEIKERIKLGVTEWQCKICGYIWRYDRNKLNLDVDPYLSAGMTRNVKWNKELAKQIKRKRIEERRLQGNLCSL